MVTIVLLNVALMWAMPRVTPLRIFFLRGGFCAGCRFAAFTHESVLQIIVVTLTFSLWPCRDDYLLAEFLNALLAGDGLARALAGASVGSGPLAADGQAAAMAVAAIAVDVAQAGDVLLKCGAEPPSTR